MEVQDRNFIPRMEHRTNCTSKMDPSSKKGLKDKSDISYLKTSQAFNVPIHSRTLLAAIPCINLKLITVLDCSQ